MNNVHAHAKNGKRPVQQDDSVNLVTERGKNLMNNSK